MNADYKILNPSCLQTASEVLTLEEEFTMQKSWREDGDKLTFIVLSRDKLVEENINKDVDNNLDNNNLQKSEKESCDKDDEICKMVGDKKDDISAMIGNHETEIRAMIGDVNLFFLFSPHVAEINIMIADTESRRGGYGSEVLGLVMNYALQYLPSQSRDGTESQLTPGSQSGGGTQPELISGSQSVVNSKTDQSQSEAIAGPVTTFSAKISDDNAVSVKFFKRNGFTEISHSECFKEFTLELECGCVRRGQLNCQPYRM